MYGVHRSLSWRQGNRCPRGDGKLVAVPWAVYSATSERRALTVKVHRKKIYNAPAFDYTRMDEYARPDYINNVRSYYGVSPGPGSAIGASAGTTEATDVTGTAGATATPGEVASPTPARTAPSNGTGSARPHGLCRRESRRFQKREFVTKNNAKRDDKGNTVADWSGRNSIANHDRRLSFGKHHHSE